MHTLDTRDLNKRLQELQDLRDAIDARTQELEEAKAVPSSTEEEIEALQDAVDAAQYEFGKDEAEELKELEELESEISEWRYGETMIPESDFEDYARELAEDIGAINRDAAWPLNFIDWPAAADALRMDYTSVTYQGTTYLVRS